ncbi:hypothetical protein M378DRAFT_16682 [Amanita muscaria Koide BX008]|uniref:Uncharacterized protein n=1 Tax=Amanita muscaria (strain Koide BX008) TaxID=946122 RepID=A0A0C2SS87_AMAMK|nr:hypothetical protein M378DRAFT_16682 [Amanita muscaria Koide BX008]
MTCDVPRTITPTTDRPKTSIAIAADKKEPDLVLAESNGTNQDEYIIRSEQLWFWAFFASYFVPSMGQNTGDQTPSTENPGVHTGGGAFFGNANFTGGGHTFGNNSTINNTQDYSTRNIHDNSNKVVIGGGSNNTVNSGDNSGNQTLKF